MKQAQEKELQLTQHALLDYTHAVSEGTPFEDLLKPEYWAHVAQKLRPHTLIKVVPEDGSYWAELLVLSCDRLWAKVFVLRHHDLTEAVAEAQAVGSRLAEFDILWKGPAKKHVVIRKADSTMLAGGIQTKGEAQAWLDNHIKTIG